MEDSDFNNKITNLINIDNLPKMNSSDSIFNVNLNEEQIEKIKNIYIKDFIKFNYN